MITRNLFLTSGDDFYLEFESKDLAGAVIYSQIRDSLLRLIATFTTSISGNKIILEIDSSVTSLIRSGLYKYDIRVKRGQDITTEYRGEVLIV